MFFQPSHLRALPSLIAGLLLSAAVLTATVPGLCNTGLSNGSGLCTGPVVVADTGTTNDANWEIAVPSPSASSTAAVVNPCAQVSAACGAKLTYKPAWVDLPNSAWLANDNVSEWITPQVENNLGGQYVYSITFQVPTTANFVTIKGQLLSDNEVWGIYLSSGSYECIPLAGLLFDNAAVNSPSDFVVWKNFKFTKVPVKAGATATLYFLVRNRGVGGIDSNPTDTGLRVEFDQTISVFLP